MEDAAAISSIPTSLFAIIAESAQTLRGIEAAYVATFGQGFDAWHAWGETCMVSAPFFGQIDGNHAASAAPWPHPEYGSGKPAPTHVYSDGQGLVLRRDTCGRDALWYAGVPGGFIVSSDPVAIARLLSGDATPELDGTSVLNFLMFGQPRRNRSLFRSVLAVPAAYTVTLTPVTALEPTRMLAGGQTAPQPTRYWSPLAAPLAKTDATDRLAALESALDDACCRALDRPDLGLFLSGGLDSSYLADAANHRGIELRCFTIGYPQAELEDEAEYASIAATKFGHRLHVVPIDEDRIVASLDRCFRLEQPPSSWTCLSNAVLLDAMSEQGITGALSGLGADEAIGNYDRMLDYYFRVREFIRDAGSASHDILANVEEIEPILFPGVARFFERDGLRPLLDPHRETGFVCGDLRSYYSDHGELNDQSHLFGRMVAHECDHRIPELLLRTFCPPARERGIDLQFPFLDPAFVEKAASLFPRERFAHEDGRWRSKLSMRAICAHKLPAELLSRKRGIFDFPFGFWLQRPVFGDFVKREISESAIWEAGLFNVRALPLMLDRVESACAGGGNARSLEEIWIVFSLAAWYTRRVGASASCS